MTSTLPRIRDAKAVGATSLDVTWADGKKDRINLAGWIATGGEILSALVEPKTFKTACVGDFGASVEWGDDDDLAIDAVHLEKIAVEQRTIKPKELADWQRATNLTNEEVAALLGISRSSWASYKSGTPIPQPVWMTIRAAQRDPVILHAHYRPLKGKAGRPPNPVPQQARRKAGGGGSSGRPMR